MMYAIEVGSCDTIYTTGFIKIGSGTQKLIWVIHTQTHRQRHNLIILLLYFKQGN
jgi:hypothetical protein